jgi:hypothetical protein
VEYSSVKQGRATARTKGDKESTHSGWIMSVENSKMDILYSITRIGRIDTNGRLYSSHGTSIIRKWPKARQSQQGERIVEYSTKRARPKMMTEGDSNSMHSGSNICYDGRNRIQKTENIPHSATKSAPNFFKGTA